MNTDLLYNQALKHRSEHKCSAVPYESGSKLLEVLVKLAPNQILEIGTGIGYTATIMALQSIEAGFNTEIDTLEKDPEHVILAQEFIKQNQVDHLVTIIDKQAEQFLPTLDKHYDFIFFDGYQIHHEFLPQYERLLNAGGILFLANNNLKSKTSEKFFHELKTNGEWEILEQFADTTIAKRLAS